jgi:hypothetical protein
MVFRIEGQATRDDWDALTTIAEPRAKMLEALAMGKADEARSYLQAAKVAVFLSNDLTDAHKRVVAKVLDKELNEFGAEEAVTGAPPSGEAFSRPTARRRRSMSDAMRQAPSVSTVSADPVSAQEILGR